ncbi:MAG: hypothetical protein EBR01_12650 [Proteobacteria bacterium]|nr:hypothetical protein [Pseudomonadota bacterium]
MKILKALTIAIVLTTVVSCSSLEVQEPPTKPAAGFENPRQPDSQKRVYESLGIYSSGDKLRGDSMLEASLADALYRRKIRNITSSIVLPGAQTRAIGPVVKVLKKDNFEALLIIKNLNIVSESSRSPSGTVGNDGRSTLLINKEPQPLRILTAELEFIDLKSKNTVWTGQLTFQDTNSLPVLIEKTAIGIADYLANKQLIP